MEQWKIYKIADIVDEISMGPFGSNIKVENFISEGIPVLNGSNLQGYRLNEDSFNYVSEEKANSLGKANAYRGDVVITHRGTLGQIIYIPSDSKYERYVISQSQFRLKLKKDIVRPDFLVYYFHTAIGQHKILMNASQVGVPALARPTSTFREVTLPIPPMDIQNKVMDILLSIDGKLTVNKQINDNLEQQASSLLSDWISTYPCRTYKLSDICKYANAKCETGNLTTQNYISTENMLPNKKGIVEASNIPTGKATCYKVDDVLIANIRPYFQKIWKADINGGCSADVLCIRANIESHSPILYWLLHQDAFFEYVMTGAKGCKMPRGDKQHIMNWSIDLPEVQCWADLATQLDSIDQQIAYNRIESINLSNLRDTLLPKLMSGELKINEIDC